MPTVTFNKVFKAEGSKNGKSWTRWDYKTADGQRFPHFAGSQEIALETPVNIEVDDRGTIRSHERAGNQQAAPEPQNGSQGVTEAPVASQAPSVRDTQIHRQTAAKVAAKLLDFFPEDEQSLETFFTVSEQLVAYFSNGVTEAVPF